jgi:hypothetical protein
VSRSGRAEFALEFWVRTKRFREAISKPSGKCIGFSFWMRTKGFREAISKHSGKFLRGVQRRPMKKRLIFVIQSPTAMHISVTIDPKPETLNPKPETKPWGSACSSHLAWSPVL